MNITALRIYKPERILYYIEPSREDMKSFRDGKMPEVLLKYDGAFGTYDCPGHFIINENGKTKKCWE